MSTNGETADQMCIRDRCIPCHRMVHNSPIPPELDAKAVRKIKKYREKLKK